MSEDHSDTDDGNGEGEGVWSPDIEQCFREALILFPPCGRRKHTVREEGGRKMYGRNELIARHIMMRTGKVRTRKQVSSHIQVLARRKAKAEACGPHAVSTDSRPTSTTINNNSHLMRNAADDVTSSHQQHHLHQLPGAYDVWADRSIVTQKIRLVQFSAFIEYRTPSLLLAHHHNHQIKHDSDTTQNFLFTQQHHHHQTKQETDTILNNNVNLDSHQHTQTFHQTPHSTTSTGFTRHNYIKIDYSTPIARQANKLEQIDIKEIQDLFPEIGAPDGLYSRGSPGAFYLVKFWADLNNDHEYNIDDQNSYFGYSSHFETIEPMEISCSTKACSYGNNIVEKLDNVPGILNSSTGKYSYDIDKSPMCDFMIQFIKKLRQLSGPSQINSVLDKLSVLQVVSSKSNSEVLLCLAYVFAIAEQIDGPRYHVYKLRNR